MPRPKAVAGGGGDAQGTMGNARREGKGIKGTLRRGRERAASMCSVHRLSFRAWLASSPPWPSKRTNEKRSPRKGGEPTRARDAEDARWLLKGRSFKGSQEGEGQDMKT